MEESRAPRFRAYLDKFRAAIIMSRSDWDRLARYQNGPIDIDLSDTPLSSIIRDAKVVGSFAERSEEGKAILTIFRDNPKDAPNNINVDKYEIWEHVPSHINYEKTVISADTDDDLALRNFLDDYVFIVPIEKGIWHHLPDVPAIYKAILETKKNAS